MAQIFGFPDSPGMPGGKKTQVDKARQRLAELTSGAGSPSLETLSKAIGRAPGYLRDFLTKGSPKKLDGDDRKALAKQLRIDEIELMSVDKTQNRKIEVAGRDNQRLASFGGGGRTGPYEVLTEKVYVIGSVQAGAWKEAYQTPEEEWVPMQLPPNRRFPGVKRYGLFNEGQSMNKVLPDGGVWIFVRLEDLTGIGPGPDDLVIVERRRGADVEATCKRLMVVDGKPILAPESDDPSFQPLPFKGGPEEEIRVVGLVVGKYNGDL